MCGVFFFSKPFAVHWTHCALYPLKLYFLRTGAFLYMIIVTGCSSCSGFVRWPPVSLTACPLLWSGTWSRVTCCVTWLSGLFHLQIWRQFLSHPSSSKTLTFLKHAGQAVIYNLPEVGFVLNPSGFCLGCECVCTQWRRLAFSSPRGPRRPCDDLCWAVKLIIWASVASFYSLCLFSPCD